MNSQLFNSIKQLSDKERKDLLSQIRIHSQPLKEEILVESENWISENDGYLGDYQDQLEIDYKKESFWKRFFYSIIASLSLRTSLKVYQNAKISSIFYKEGKTELSTFIDLKVEALKPVFASKLFLLYVSAQEIKPFFSYIKDNEELFATVVYKMVVKKILEPKEKLSDFFSEVEIMEIISQDQNHSEKVSAIISERIDNYLEQVHSDVFYRVQEKIEMFLTLKEISLFPYEMLMNPFLSEGDVLQPSEDTIETFKKTVSFLEMRDVCEKFFQLLKLVSSLSFDNDVFNYIFHSYYEDILKVSVNAQDSSENSLKELTKQSTLGFYNNLITFSKSVSFTDFLKILKKNPYYILTSTELQSSLNVKRFYKMSLLMNLTKDWKSYSKEILSHYYREEIRTFLCEDAINAIESAPSIFEGKNYGNFPSWNEVVLLHFFLIKYGEPLLLYVLQILFNTVLVNKMTYRSLVEEKERILSEMNKDAKIHFTSLSKERVVTLKSMVSSSTSDNSEESYIRWLKKEEVKSRKILDDFYSYLKVLKKTLEDFKKSPDLASLMNISHIINDKKLPTSEALSTCIYTIDKYLKIVTLSHLQEYVVEHNVTERETN